MSRNVGRIMQAGLCRPDFPAVFPATQDQNRRQTAGAHLLCGKRSCGILMSGGEQLRHSSGGTMSNVTAFIPAQAVAVITENALQFGLAGRTLPGYSEQDTEAVIVAFLAAVEHAVQTGVMPDDMTPLPVVLSQDIATHLLDNADTACQHAYRQGAYEVADLWSSVSAALMFALLDADPDSWEPDGWDGDFDF